MGGSDLLDRFDTDLLVVFGFILAVILVTNAPYLLGVLGGLVFAAWLLVQFGVFDDEPEPGAVETPLERLQTRYANGEIDEVEFERRLARILDADEAARYERLRDRERTGEAPRSMDADLHSELDVETE